MNLTNIIKCNYDYFKSIYNGNLRNVYLSLSGYTEKSINQTIIEVIPISYEKTPILVSIQAITFQMISFNETKTYIS